MVDVDYRSHNDVHAAGLKRLSGRVCRGSTNSVANRNVCFSFAAYARNVINHLKSCHIPISPGLSDEEFLQLESAFGFAFPPDLKSILQEGLPTGVGFPNWRSSSEQELRKIINQPVAGLCYHIAKGRFWWDKWGRKPADCGQALHIARQSFKEAPVLVPIYSHCYIPSLPSLAGNPVIFVYEKDIFYCGYDLADFFEREAFIPQHFNLSIAQGEEEEHHYRVSEANENSINIIQSRRKRVGQDDSDIGCPSQRLLPASSFEIETSYFFISQEIQARKSVGQQPLQLSEKTENLVQSAGNSPRVDDQQIISRYMYFHDKPLSNTIISHFTIAAPPWAAKTARRIDFWTDLIEGHERRKDVSQNNCIPASRIQEDSSSLEFERGIYCNQRRLKSYFEDMAERLRRGGWKEEEIREMVEAALPAEGGIGPVNGNLFVSAMNVDMLIDCLIMGGWTVQDVIEVLSFEVCSTDDKEQLKEEGGGGRGFKMTTKPKAGSLADYFSKT